MVNENSNFLDFAKINQVALRNINFVLQMYLPGGKYNGKEYLPKNPTRTDNKPGSFSINTYNGAWSDFAIGKSGGDCISLIAYVLNISQYDAAKELATLLNVTPNTALSLIKKESSGIQIVAPFDNSKQIPSFVHPKHGKAMQYWIYHDYTGKPLFYICRFNIQGGKTYCPLTLWRDSINYLWKWKGYTQPYPLYNLHMLTSYPKAMVIVCEGEKAADAAGKLFPIPNYVTTTFPHGANAFKKTDWKPLHSRDVILWPDHDHAGHQCMSSIFKLLGGNNAVEREHKAKHA